jgi:hypothetical protein
MYPDKPLVYDQYAKEGEYTESKSSSPYTYAYHVPSINLKSDDAAKINAELNALCMPYINDALDCIKSGVSISTFNIDYHYYENYGTLSLLVRISRYGDRFKVYVIDTSSGKKISNTELLAKRSISEEKFLSSVKEFATAEFKQQYAGEPGTALDTERYNKTVDINNINTDTPMYFDSDGTLCVIAKIYSPAGAEYYYHILDTSL